MTQSMSCVATSRREPTANQIATRPADDVTDEEQPHPLGRDALGVGFNRDDDFAASAFSHLGQHDSQLAVFEPGSRLRRVDRRVHAHRAREAAEVAFDEMEAGRPVGRFRAVLLANDQHHASLDQHANGFRRNSGDVEHDFDGPLGLVDVLQRQTFARNDMASLGSSTGEVLEEPAHLLPKVTDVSGDE